MGITPITTYLAHAIFRLKAFPLYNISEDHFAGEWLLVMEGAESKFLWKKEMVHSFNFFGKVEESVLWAGAV